MLHAAFDSWITLPDIADAFCHDDGDRGHDERLVPYTRLMSSRSAEDTRRARAARLAAMTPDERVQLAARLREEGLAAYMSTHGVDRTTAIAQVKATRRLGRRRSASAEERGFLDLRDAAALFALEDRAVVTREVEAHLDEVRPDIRAAWNELVNAVDR